MSHAFYNLQWQSAMEDLSSAIETENPPIEFDDKGKPLPPRPISWSGAFHHFALLYLRYISIFRRLEECYDQIIHPQKRRDIRLVLETVQARLLQVKEECVKFGYDGRHSDYLNLDEYVLHLKLSLRDLEIPIPHYFQEVNDHNGAGANSTMSATEAAKKRDVLDKCLEEFGLLAPNNNGAAGSASSSSSSSSSVGSSLLSSLDDSSLLVPRMTREQAIRIIQKNERGRQGHHRGLLMRDFRAEEAARARAAANEAGGGGAGGAGAGGGNGNEAVKMRDPTNAATTIQAVWRGYAARLRIARMVNEEYVFIGMRAPFKKDDRGGGGDKAGGGNTKQKYDPTVKEEQFRKARKIKQSDNELKYVEALVELQKHVMEAEGPDLRDQMWESRYQWWIRQKEKTGKYPDNFDLYYKEVEPPVEGTEVVAPVKKVKKKVKVKGDDAKANPQLLSESAQRNARLQGAKKAEEEKKAKLALSMKTFIGPSHLVNHMHECVAKYVSVWSSLDESGNPSQQHDDNIAKSKLRPLVREKIRREVDVKLLSYLGNIKLKVAQRQAASGKTKKKSKRGESKKKKKAAEDKAAQGKMGNLSARTETSPGSNAGVGANPTSGTGAGAGSSLSTGPLSPTSPSTRRSLRSARDTRRARGRKCCDGEKACLHLPLGDMISLLVKMGIAQDNKRHPLAKSLSANFIGDAHVLGSNYEQAGVNLDPSCQQLRACITEYAILPQGSPYVKEQAPLINAILLYGPHGVGKTALSRSIALESNSAWFDLSPRNVEKKLGTKADIVKLVHMVFKVAQELQPSVIYIDDVDKVWITSKTKSTTDLFKMKQAIVQHKAMLTRNVRVLVVGNSRVPFHDKVDRRDLIRFFGSSSCGRMLYCPCPNYPTRLKLWKHFLSATGLSLALLEGASLHSLSHSSSAAYSNSHSIHGLGSSSSSLSSSGSSSSSSLDLTTLAYISEGYSAGSILTAVSVTYPARRVSKMIESGRSIDVNELMAALAKTNYTYKNDYINFVKFTDEITGEKERRRLKELQAQKAAEEKADENKMKRRKPKPKPKA